jgi:hypothetical protein
MCAPSHPHRRRPVAQEPERPAVRWRVSSLVGTCKCAQQRPWQVPVGSDECEQTACVACMLSQGCMVSPVSRKHFAFCSVHTQRLHARWKLTPDIAEHSSAFNSAVRTCRSSDSWKRQQRRSHRLAVAVVAAAYMQWLDRVSSEIVWCRHRCTNQNCTMSLLCISSIQRNRGLQEPNAARGCRSNRYTVTPSIHVTDCSVDLYPAPCECARPFKRHPLSWSTLHVP